MLEENITNQNAGSEEDKASNKKEAKYYLDLVFSEGFKGPSKSSISKSQKLTKALGVIAVNNNLTIKIGVQNPTGSNKPQDEIHVIVEGSGEPPEDVIKTVAAYSKAFDNLTQEKPGTDAYIDYDTKFDKQRRLTLESLGFDPDSKDIVFTEAQRSVYNAAMKPMSFKYYRMQLTWKQPGKKKVRSASYSSLKMMDVNKTLHNMGVEADKIKPNIKVTKHTIL